MSIMKLQEIISGINPIEVIGSVDINITGVNIDSRRISDGHLFIAMRGNRKCGTPTVLMDWRRWLWHSGSWTI